MTLDSKIVDSYEYEFETIWNHAKSLAVFLQFVDSEKNTENTDFVFAVQKFRQLPSSETSKHIFETYIETNSACEINLSKTVKTQIANNLQANAMDTKAFDDAYSHVMLNLKMDVFSRFIRSDMWKQFCANQQEKFLQEIGIHKSKIKYVELDVQDLELPYITEKDFTFAMFMAKDYLFWQPLNSGKNMSAYSSKETFLTKECTAKHGNLMLNKLVFQLDISALQFSQLLSTRAFYKITMSDDPVVLEYIPLSEKVPYATSIFYSEGGKTLITTQREILLASSIIYDSEQKRYIRISRSCQYEKKPVQPDNIRVSMYAVDVIQETSSTSCTVSRIHMMNLHGMLESVKLASAVINTIFSKFLFDFRKKVYDFVKRYAHGTIVALDDLKMMQVLHENMKAKGKEISKAHEYQQDLIHAAIKVLPRCYGTQQLQHGTTCAILGTNDTVYTGISITCKDVRNSLCAEQVAIAKMIADGCHKLHAICITHEQDGDDNNTFVSCGSCCSLISEFASSTESPLFVHHRKLGKTRTTSISHVYPSTH